MPTKPTHTWSHLKTRLKDLEKDKLLLLLHDLYDLNADNRVYLSTRLLAGTSEDLVAPYRRIIKQVFNPDRGVPSLKLSAARKALNDFKKACADTPAVVDLMLFYVEEAITCTRTYGDMRDVSFYQSLVSVYSNAADLIYKIDDPALTIALHPRFKELLDDSTDLGWNVYDELINIYLNAFPPGEDEWP